MTESKDNCPELGDETDQSDCSSGLDESVSFVDEDDASTSTAPANAVQQRGPPSPYVTPQKSILKMETCFDGSACCLSSSGASPAAPHRVLRGRCASLPSSFGEDDKESKPSSQSRSCRSVTFHKVSFREHSLTVGDHPDCVYGPPVSLDWDVLGAVELDLEHYEGSRSQRRNLRQLQMNAYRRKNLLTFRFGLTEGEIEAATKEKDRARRNRFVTRSLLPAMAIEEGFRSAGRKIRRAVDADVRKSEKEAKEFVRRHSSTLGGIDGDMLSKVRTEFG